jgi:hypothetical protein
MEAYRYLKAGGYIELTESDSKLLQISAIPPSPSCRFEAACTIRGDWWSLGREDGIRSDGNETSRLAAVRSREK